MSADTRPADAAACVHRWVISKDVDCRMCIAKAGEDCYLQPTWREAERTGRSYYRDPSRGHTARVKCEACGSTGASSGGTA